jgi:hypothetical protein
MNVSTSPDLRGLIKDAVARSGGAPEIITEAVEASIASVVEEWDTLVAIGTVADEPHQRLTRRWAFAVANRALAAFPGQSPPWRDEGRVAKGLRQMVTEEITAWEAKR